MGLPNKRLLLLFFYNKVSGVGRLGVTVRSLAEMVNKDELARAFHLVQAKY